MRKIVHKILLLSFIFLAFVGCNNDDDGDIFAQSSSENDFVWRAMNLWYFWQADVPNLADSQLNNNYNDFLNSFATPDLLFANLLNEPADRFSAIFSDRNDLLNSFAGVSTSFGYEFGLYRIDGQSPNIVGFVEYVVEGSPAANAGIQRGDFFTSINGTVLTENNFNGLLFGNATYTLGFADFDGGNFTSNGTEQTITAIELTENPVFLSEVIEENGVKIGYLVYNSFTSSFDVQLNNAIGSLASEGITELVLDLRYNGGGSVRSAQYLGSMITGDFIGQEFASLIFNEKAQSQNTRYDFVTQIGDSGPSLNLLGLDHLYVLTTGSSASASEMVINSLRPYIDVTTIGTRTTGKNVGQIPLFDSPESAFTNPNTASTSHTWALLPITFSYFNADGNNNFGGGIPADHEVIESNFFNDVKQLGDPQEPLLRRAIDVILGNPISSGDTVNGLSDQNGSLISSPAELIMDSKQQKPLGNSMYLEEPIFLNP